MGGDTSKVCLVEHNLGRLRRILELLLRLLPPPGSLPRRVVLALLLVSTGAGARGATGRRSAGRAGGGARAERTTRLGEDGRRVGRRTVGLVTRVARGRDEIGAAGSVLLLRGLLLLLLALLDDVLCVLAVLLLPNTASQLRM